MGIWFKDWVDLTFLPLYHCFLPSYSTYLSHDERLFYPLTLIPTHLSLAIVFKDWVDLTFCYGCIILVFVWVSTVVCLATVIGQWLLWRVKALLAFHSMITCQFRSSLSLRWIHAGLPLVNDKDWLGHVSLSIFIHDSCERWPSD